MKKKYVFRCQEGFITLGKHPSVASHFACDLEDATQYDSVRQALTALQVRAAQMGSAIGDIEMWSVNVVTTAQVDLVA